jgi:hypothetical protein
VQVIDDKGVAVTAAVSHVNRADEMRVVGRESLMEMIELAGIVGAP